MYVVTKYGKKLHVDDSAIDYDNESVSSLEKVALVDDDAELKPSWVATFQRRKQFDSCEAARAEKIDFVAEVIFDHEPTKEELMWHMSAWGLGCYDIVTIEKAFMLGWKRD